VSQLFLIQPSTCDDASLCPLCNGVEHITDIYTGEVICIKCGCVLNDPPLNAGGEYGLYTESDYESKQRVGMGTNLGIYDKGLYTVISGGWDAQGNRLNGKTRTRIKRLKQQDDRSKTNETYMRNLSIAMALLSRISSELHLPEHVKEEAALLYRKALSLNLIRGRSIDAFIAASVYAACRLLSMPRTLNQVSESAHRPHSEVSSTYRLLHRELGLRPQIDKPFKFLPEIASVIGVNAATEFLAADILHKAQAQGELTGKGPRGVAAAALYLAAQKRGERLVQRTVAKAAGTTEVTLRNRYRGLIKALNDAESE